MYLFMPRFASQNLLHVSLPIVMSSNQSLIQVSSFVDFTRVMLGPKARWAPEQFRQIRTPKSMEAPKLKGRVTGWRFTVTICALHVIGTGQQLREEFLLDSGINPHRIYSLLNLFDVDRTHLS